MAKIETINELFTYGERNNHGPFGPSTYMEIEIEMDCTGEDYDAAKCFLQGLFCGENCDEEDFERGLFNGLVGDHLPDDVEEAQAMFIDIARAFKGLPASSTAKDIVKNIQEYREACKEAERIGTKKRNFATNVYLGFKNLKEESSKLSAEKSKRLIEEDIIIEENSIKSCEKRIENSKQKLLELKKKLEQFE